MNKILVTGGCGYIGSHTIVDLIQHGYEVISIDNNSRSSNLILEGVKKITGKFVKNYCIDLCNLKETENIFKENDDIIGVVHFAAFKSVNESVENPLLYFHNNINSLLNVLKCCEKFSISNFVFSSSCTVYGNAEIIPVTEDTPLKEAESPYGYTKQIGEKIIQHFINSNGLQTILLRYFNPVGAHFSNEIGEMPIGKPTNLVPIITQTAIGKLSNMKIFGNDYPTKDGSCIRDFIHVSDIARAHTLSLNLLIEKKNKTNCEVFNLGSGNGYSVLELINCFEKISKVKLNYSITNRRNGDVIAIFADNNKAKNILGWVPSTSLEDMLYTAWNWELKMKNEKLLFNN